MSEITLTFGADDWAFLELQAEESALEPAQVVAMLVRKARKAYERPAVTVQHGLPDFDIMADERARVAERMAVEDQRQREITEREIKKQALLDQLAELEGDKPSYIEVDAVLAETGIPEFDEKLLGPREPPEPFQAIALQQPRAAARTFAPHIPGSAQPGTVTGPVGFRRDLTGGDIIGDHRGNVLRRNFKHLGSG